MWILIVIAVHANDPSDVPGWVRIPMESKAQCERARAGVTSWLKFGSFKVETRCEPHSGAKS